MIITRIALKDESASTITSHFGGKFEDKSKIVELQNTLNYLSYGFNK
jgi:GTP cyclohydrolase I